MIEKLKEIIDQKGFVKVSSDLGYRSINTIKSWLKDDRIPGTAIERVEKYLEKQTKRIK